MLTFGVDVPLIEIIIALLVITSILFIEAMVVISLLLKQLNNSKKVSQMTSQLTETLLEIKRLELQELDKLKKK